MDFSIFWSWQSDAPDKCNRGFIRKALDAAVKELVEDAEILDSPRVESGMENVAGTPDVAQVMFDKIELSDIIVCDVSLVGQISPLQKGKGCKKVPNPNVMAEMGYGAGRMGWGRVICVMNEHYGTRAELPFDVQSKRYPVNYTINPDNTTDSGKVKEELTNWLRIAIETCMKDEHQGVVDAISKLDIQSLLICSMFQDVPYFDDLSQNPDASEAQKYGIDIPGFRIGILRLLDLKMLETDVQNSLYAYHWSHRGKLLIKELKKRNKVLSAEQLS